MDAKEFEIALHDAEVRLDRLKALYEQYFQGIERLEPHVVRKDFDRRVHAMKKSMPRNTALRFRFQMLWQRYTTYITYWNRVARQIEEGTYRRHVLRAQARRQRQHQNEVEEQLEEQPKPKTYELSLEDADVGEALKEAESEQRVPQMTFSRPTDKRSAGAPSKGNGQGAKPPPPPPRKPPPVPGGQRAADLGDDHIRKIYREYVDARRRNNERIDNVRFEAVERSIRQMLPKLQQKHKGKDIDFKVVLKNGRVGLKPVAK